MCLAFAVGAAMTGKGKIGRAVMLRAELRAQHSAGSQDTDKQVASFLAEANHYQWWGNGLAVSGVLLGILSRLYREAIPKWYSLDTILDAVALGLLVMFILFSMLIV